MRIRKTTKNKPSQTRQSGSNRTRQVPKYNSFRLHKRIKAQNIKPLPSAWRLWKTSMEFLWLNRRKIGQFLVIYAALYILFVRGLSGGIDLGGIKDALKTDSSTATGLLTSVTLFGVLLSTSNATTSEAASIYQTFLLIVGSLAFIWLLRNLISGNNKLRVRDAFYEGMRPLVPFVLVLLVIAIEFIPLSISGFVLNVVQTNGLITGGGEALAIYSVCLLMAILSLYLVSGSFASIYIVTLPGMEPIKAIRSSHQLLQVHRWSLVKKLILLFFFMLLAGSIVFMPLLLWIPTSLSWITELVFFACSISVFAVFHIYMYNLYKSLL